jgi:NADH-quinone oxidoreductase subunit M
MGPDGACRGHDGNTAILLGAFQMPDNRIWAILAATGVILSACYMLWMFQRVIFGPVTHEENRNLKDLSLRERLVFAPLLILIFWMGVMPQPFLDRMQPALNRTLELSKQRTAAAAVMHTLPGALFRLPTGGER